MAKGGKSNNKKANKGPKGKKARAKAKLDKQWGESVVYDQGRETTRMQRQQRGSGRRADGDDRDANDVVDLDRSSNNHDRRPDRQRYHRDAPRQDKIRHKDNNSDIDTENEQEEDNPLDGLLSMIRRTKKKRRHQKIELKDLIDEDYADFNLDPPTAKGDGKMNDDESFDDEEDHKNHDDKSISSNSGEDDSLDDHDSDDSDKSEDMIDGHEYYQSGPTKAEKAEDFFRQRFSQQPLPDSILTNNEASRQQTTSAPTKMKKIVLDGSNGSNIVELLVSIPKYRDATGDSALTSTRKTLATSTTQESRETLDKPITEELIQNLPTNWQDLALATFESTNRSTLQRRWKKQIKKKLHSTRTTTSRACIMPSCSGDDDDLHAAIYSFIARYSDILVTTASSSSLSSPNRQLKEQKSFHQMYLLHILNHVLTSRSRVTRNNRLLKNQNDDGDSNKRDNANDTSSDITEEKIGVVDDEDPDRYRDQGFTRPTVLVLLPTRGTCHDFVMNLYRLAGSNWNEDIRNRFETEYGPLGDDLDDGNDVKRDAEKDQRRKAVLEQKGKEWNELFGDNANNDDDFKIGISLIPKAAKTNNKAASSDSSNVAVRLYTDFFKSDIIVASPLGLKMLILPNENENDDEGDIDESNEKKGRNASFDFLSSIEICLIEHADTIMMQNWDHVNDVLGYLNQEPQSNNNADFSRVRNYLLHGQGRYWRQLILSSKFVDPTLNSTFKRFGRSLSGSVKVRRRITNEDAAVSNVLIPIKQVFQKVNPPSLSQQGQARVDFFIKEVLPQIERQKQTHTLIYIPSYFDFCVVRNALLKRDVSFVSVTEYSRTTEVGRGRARFLQGRKPIMLYTGRAHFFYRHAIKGIKHLIFLGVPEHSGFYSDQVNLIDHTARNSDRAAIEDGEAAIVEKSSCLTLFTKYEAHALERVVGSNNCSRMIGGIKTTFMFYT